MVNIPKNTYRVEEDKDLVERWINLALKKLSESEKNRPDIKYEDRSIHIGKDDCKDIGCRFDHPLATLVANEFKKAGWICYICHNYESPCKRLDIYRREQEWSQYSDRV